MHTSTSDVIFCAVFPHLNPSAERGHQALSWHGANELENAARHVLSTGSLFHQHSVSTARPLKIQASSNPAINLFSVTLMGNIYFNKNLLFRGMNRVNILQLLKPGIWKLLTILRSCIIQLKELMSNVNGSNVKHHSCTCF